MRVATLLAISRPSMAPKGYGGDTKAFSKLCAKMASAAEPRCLGYFGDAHTALTQHCGRARYSLFDDELMWRNAVA